jgi:hypothetical protein
MIHPASPTLAALPLADLSFRANVPGVHHFHVFEIDGRPRSAAVATLTGPDKPAPPYGGSRSTMYATIIHFHLPKTAGTSINRWLDLLTSADRARPADYDKTFFKRRLGREPSLVATEDEAGLHRELGRESRGYWDVIHGHSVGLVTKHPATYQFVILRDPVSRLVSFLRDWRRLPTEQIEACQDGTRELRRDAVALDASDFVTTHAGSALFRGMSQTHALRQAVALALPERVRQSPAKTDLALARLALDELFDAVGVFEDLPGIIRHVARDVGAAPPAALGHANAGLRDDARDALSPAAVAALRASWADDFALHEHATRLAGGLAETAYDETVFESTCLAPRLAGLCPRRTGWGRVFSVDDQIVGSGFHGREGAGSPAVVAWTGPTTRAVLYVPVPADERIDLFIDVAGYIDARVRESLRLRVDGRDVAFVRRSAAAVEERLWGGVVTSLPFVKVELLVDATFSPDELHRGAGDRRRLGLAIRGYGFRVAPPAAATDPWPGDPTAAVVGGDPLDDDRHPDHRWAIDFGGIFLDRLDPDRTDDDVLRVMTFGLDDDALDAPPTATGVEEAFRRVLSRAPPQEWLDFWVGKPHLSLRGLYRDLLRGEEFHLLRQRLRRDTDAPWHPGR